MLLLVVLLLCASARGDAILEDPDCDGVIVGNFKYEMQVLKIGVELPHQLAIDYDNNILFFSHYVDADELFQPAYINLETNEFGTISGVNEGFANAVNNINNTVYFGGSDGIYKFDADSKTAIKLDITDDNIRQLFYKKALYYTEYYTETAYKIVDGNPKIVPELNNTRAILIAVDNNDNIYFVNNLGFFYYKQDGEDIIKIGEYTVNGITSDVNGNLYFSTADSLYYINDKTKQIETLTTLGKHYIGGLAIESNGNIIMAYDRSLVRLKPTDKICFSNMTIKSFE